MSEADQQPADQISEQELRERLAEEMKRVRVQDILLQTVVTLINLGGQRLGLTEETKDSRDLGQTRVAVEAVRTLLPLLQEQSEGELGPVRDALAQIQVAYAREAAGEGDEQPGGRPESADPAAGSEPQGDRGPGDAPQQGPEQQQGRTKSGLWVPPGSAN